MMISFSVLFCVFRSRRHILCSLTADILRSRSGTDKVCLADLFHFQPYRNCHVPQVHPDQGVTDIHSCMGTDVLYRHRIFHMLPDRCGKRTPGMSPWPHIHRFIPILFRRFALDDQRTVQVLAALCCQPDSSDLSFATASSSLIACSACILISVIPFPSLSLPDTAVLLCDIRESSCILTLSHVN